MSWAAPAALFGCVLLALALGYPVAFTLAGVSLLFAFGAAGFGAFDLALLNSLPSRFLGIVLSDVLVAIPMFVAMGVLLERTRLAADLLDVAGRAMGRRPGGLGLAALVVGLLLAASTGVAGAAIVTMGLMTLPAMLAAGYDRRLAAGTLCAAGTLGQIVPPSIALVLLGELLQGAHAEAQRAAGNWGAVPVSVVDLFAGALLPGVLLAMLYGTALCVLCWRRPALAPPLPDSIPVRPGEWLLALMPPLALVLAVLGAILAGLATPTESAALGAVGAALLGAMRGRLDGVVLLDALLSALRLTGVVFAILLGASVFALVFRGLDGDLAVEAALSALPGGATGALLSVLALMFVLGFFMDFVEIMTIVVPVAAPVLIGLGVDALWLGILVALVVQTSFMTPPFGFALFYLRSVAPDEVSTRDIYAGALPFVCIQLVAIACVAAWPSLATWVPGLLFG